MSDLASTFTNPDPVEAMSLFIGCFGRFWDVDRLVMRRLRSLAALEREVGTVISARDERRRSGLSVLVARLNNHDLLSCEPDEAVRMLFSLTSFETFDALAGPDRELTEVAQSVLLLAGRWFGTSSGRAVNAMPHIRLWARYPGQAFAHHELTRPHAGAGWPAREWRPEVGRFQTSGILSYWRLWKYRNPRFTSTNRSSS